MVILAMAVGGIAGFGVFLLVGWTRRTLATGNVRFDRGITLPSAPTLISAAAGALVAGLATRWPAAALGGALFGYCLPVILPLLRSDEQTIVREEAIATWIEMLRDTVAVGQGLRDVLKLTAGNVPDPIAQPVRRLNRQLRDANAHGDPFGELALGLDSQVGSLTAIALSQVDRGGVGNVSDLLNDLAHTARSNVSMRRRVETARQKARASTRGLLVVFVALVIGFRFLTPAYLHPYDSATGQLVLLFVMAIFGSALYWLVRLNRLNAPEPLRLVVPQEVRR